GPFGYMSPSAVQPIVLALVVIGTLSFALRGRRRTEGRRRAWAQAWLWTLVCLALSITPHVTWGREVYRSPLFWLWEGLPLGRALRVPSRLGVGALIGLCLLAGLAFDEGTRRLRLAGDGVGQRVARAAIALVLCVAIVEQYADAWWVPHDLR